MRSRRREGADGKNGAAAASGERLNSDRGAPEPEMVSPEQEVRKERQR